MFRVIWLSKLKWVTLYIADIFTKQAYVEKVYLTFGLKPTRIGN